MSLLVLLSLPSLNSIHQQLFLLWPFVQIFNCSSELIICLDFSSTVYFFLFRYSVGTAHGFALFNYRHQKVLLAQSTLDPNATATASATPLSVGQATLNRGRSLKKSLRESFRRLRKGRTIKKATMIDRIDEDQPFTSNENQTSEIIRVPVERQVEFRDLKPVQDHVLTMVRCLYFAQTYLNSGNPHSIFIIHGSKHFSDEFQYMIEPIHYGWEQTGDMFMSIRSIIFRYHQIMI